MADDVDWSHGVAHMWGNHGVSVSQASEALADPDRVLIQPDYNSRSGNSDRVIGYSHSFEDLLTIILVRNEGAVYGANGWRSNDKDRALYDGSEKDGSEA